jgi:hypothetical protein
MPYIEIDTEIFVSPGDYLSECSEQDIDEIIEFLESESRVRKPKTITRQVGFQTEQFNKEVMKLIGNKGSLTVEEEETILNITKRLL